MEELISKEKLYKEILYYFCVDCERRKNGKRKLYDIRSVVCKACDINGILGIIESMDSLELRSENG